MWELIGLLGVKPTPEMATCCYLALMTDTGRFQYQNTDARALSSASSMVAAGASPSLCAREAYQNRSIASLKLDSLTVDRMVVGVDGRFAYSWVTPEDMERLGATKDDVDGLTDILRSLQGVAIAAILRVQGMAPFVAAFARRMTRMCPLLRTSLMAVGIVPPPASPTRGALTPLSPGSRSCLARVRFDETWREWDKRPHRH